MDIVKSKKSAENVFLFNLMFFAIGFFVVLFSLFQNELNTICGICILQLMINVIWLKGNGYSWISLPMIFLLLIFLFHCSYFVLWFIDGYDPSNKFTAPYIYQYTTQENWTEAGKFCIMFFYLFVSGVVLYRKKQFKSKKVFSKNQCGKIGLIISCMCLLPRLYSDLYTLLLYVQGGYLSTFQATHGFVQTLADGFYIGIIFMMLGANDQKKAGKYLLVGILFCLFGMLSGRRLEKVVYVVSLFFVYFKFVNVKN